jgi:hypothetical protein
MSRLQKAAFFNLIIVVLALATVFGLYPFLGRASAGGFGLLGFLGFGPLFFWKHGGEVVVDERDQIIAQRSTVIAYSIFWVAFVASSMIILSVYGADGTVPVSVIVSAVWLGLMLVVAIHAIATLAQYGRVNSDARS